MKKDEKQRSKGRIHSVESFGAVDGPGIRTVFFLQGCPARCIYCHNPDTWNQEGGREITIDEILSTAARGRPYYGSEGGVTFSGGEPLMQGKFVAEAAAELQRTGIGTVLDTSGTYTDKYTPDAVRNSQLLLLDIKHWERQGFTDVTGCSKDSLEELIRIVNEMDKPVWIRHVVVPGRDDTKDDILKLKDFIGKIKNVYTTELLGYHDMGAEKYDKMGIKYRLAGVEPMNEKRLAELQSLL